MQRKKAVAFLQDTGILRKMKLCSNDHPMKLYLRKQESWRYSNRQIANFKLFNIKYVNNASWCTQNKYSFLILYAYFIQNFKT